MLQLVPMATYAPKQTLARVEGKLVALETKCVPIINVVGGYVIYILRNQYQFINYRLIILHFVETVMYPFYDFTGLGYISKPKKSCNGIELDKEYSTISLAQVACSDDDECKAVVQRGCNGGFWTCTDLNTNLVDSESSCSWLRGSCKLYIFIIEFSYLN